MVDHKGTNHKKNPYNEGLEEEGLQAYQIN